MKKIYNQIGQNKILFLILLLAAALRLYRLARVPPSLHWDETALGYNAYSILKTGRDEYGKLLPLIFKSFGDYKPGLYVYLAVPSVFFFGLNEFAVRLPSALAGVAAVWLLYRVVLLLFEKRKLALFSSFALAVSPWHLQFSRGAWEANVALFFILSGIFCFLKTGERTIKLLYLSTLSFAAAVLTYQGGKMTVPLIVFGLIICFTKKFKKLPRKHLTLVASLLLILSLPILVPAFIGGGGRLKVMSVFSYHRPAEEVNRILSEGNGSQFYFKVFQGEAFFFIRSILTRYFNHFSGKFLFFEGDWSSARHSVPYAGVLYYPDFIFLIAGIYWLIQQRSKSEKFVWYWLLVSPLPAAFSRDAVQSVRSLNMVLPLMIIIAGGMYQVYLWLRNQRKQLLLTLYFLLCTFYLWSFTYYLDQYYIHYPLRSSQFWQYGYKQIVNKIYPIRNDYSKIIFTQKWGQSYIYWLFYSEYNPASYQKQAKLTENPYGDVGTVEKIDNLEFRDFYWPSERMSENRLFIGNGFELPLEDIDPDQARILDEVKFLNDETAFRLVETL